MNSPFGLLEEEEKRRTSKYKTSALPCSFHISIGQYHRQVLPQLAKHALAFALMMTMMLVSAIPHIVFNAFSIEFSRPLKAFRHRL